MNRSTINKLLLAAVPVMVLTACGDSDVAQAIGTAEPQVRFANVSPNASTLTLQRNGANRNEATNVAYPTITNYFNVDNNNATYDVRLASGGTSVGTVNIDAERGRKYTVLAVAESPTTNSIAVLNDPTNLSFVNDRSRVRVFNASYNAQNIDVYLIGQSQNIASLSPDLANVAFKNAGPTSGTDSLERPGSSNADPYRVVVTTAGTKNILFQGNYVIRDRQNLLFVVVPNSASNPTSVGVIVKQGDDATATIPRL